MGPKKITIINSYDSRNKGDASIVIGMINTIKKSCFVKNIDLVTLAPVYDKKFKDYRDLNVVPAPSLGIKNPKLLSFIYTMTLLIIGVLFIRIFNYLPKIFSCNKYTYNFLKSVKDTDIILSCGGGYWQDSWGYSVIVHLMQLVVAALSKKRIIAFGISVGPFKSKFYSKLIGWWLNYYKVIVVREKTSLDELKKMGVNRPCIKLGTDAAFAISVDKLGITKGKNYKTGFSIGVTVREWSFPGKKDKKKLQNNYEKQVAYALDYLISEYNASIYFIPQVVVHPNDDDRVVAKRVKKMVKNKHNIHVYEDNFSICELVNLLMNMDIVIATRFHSAILSFIANVPVVAIEYEHKTSGIMEQLDLVQYVVSIDKIDYSEIIHKFNKLLNNKEQICNIINDKMKDLSNNVHNDMDLCLKKLK